MCRTCQLSSVPHLRSAGDHSGLRIVPRVLDFAQIFADAHRVCRRQTGAKRLYLAAGSCSVDGAHVFRFSTLRSWGPCAPYGRLDNATEPTCSGMAVQPFPERGALDTTGSPSSKLWVAGMGSPPKSVDFEAVRARPPLYQCVPVPLSSLHPRFRPVQRNK